MAIVTIEFLSVHRRNIGREVALMIEAQHVRIAGVPAFQLKFRMPFPKGCERGGETLRRPRQRENDLLRRMRMPMKRVARKLHSFLRGCGHERGIIMASGALGACDQTKIRQTAMFLVTSGTGTILNNVRFMKRVLLVAGLAFAIDRFHGDAVAKSIAEDLAKFPGNDRAIVAFRAIVRELRVSGCNFAGVKKSFATATREEKNREQPAEDCCQTDDQPRPSPGMEPPIVPEIAFVTLGNLLLRATGFRHRLSN